MTSAFGIRSDGDGKIGSQVLAGCLGTSIYTQGQVWLRLFVALGQRRGSHTHEWVSFHPCGTTRLVGFCSIRISVGLKLSFSIWLSLV
jgi:hypothetical protein